MKRLRISKRINRRMVLASVLVLFGLAGGAYIINSMAAGPFVSSEPENGTLTGGATSITDSTASGGKAIGFATSGGGGGTGNNCASTVAPPAGVSTSYSLGFCDDFSGASVDTSKWSFQST